MVNNSQYRPKTVNRVITNLKWLKWSKTDNKTVKNCQNRQKQTKIVKNGQNRQNYTKMVKNGQKMINNGKQQSILSKADTMVKKVKNGF